MLRAEVIRMVGSKETNFFQRFYCLPCVGFSRFHGERGLVCYCPLENYGAAVACCTAVSAFAFVDSIEINPTTLSESSVPQLNIELCFRVSRHFGLACASRAVYTSYV